MQGPLLVLPFKQCRLPCLSPDMVDDLINHFQGGQLAIHLHAQDVFMNALSAKSSLVENSLVILTTDSLEGGSKAITEILTTVQDQHRIRVDYVCSSVDVVPYETGRKRCRLSVENTLKNYQNAVALSQDLKKTNLLAPISSGGGHRDVESLTIFCAKKIISTTTNQVGGVYIDFKDACNAKEEYSISKTIISEITNNEVSNRPLIVANLGSCTPFEILEYIKLGVDVVESDYALLMSRLGLALVFKFLKDDDTETKKTSSSRMTLNMRDRDLAFDQNPIVKSGKTLACRNHSRAYIHHLVQGREMLGEALVYLHNLAHMLEFFAEIREHKKNGTLENYMNWFSAINQIRG